MNDQRVDTAGAEAHIDSRELARTGTKLLLLALVVGLITGAATWLFLFVDHHGVVFLWETLPERFPSAPTWAVPVAVVVAMTAIASLIALVCKGRPFDTGVAEHEYDQEGRMEYRRMLPGAAFALASLFSGAAIGPEAPLIDINGGLGTLLADTVGLRPKQVKMMAYAGVAGALAAFLGGAPMGALLAMEFISPKSVSMSRTDMVLGLTSGATAWATYIMLGGHPIAMLFPFAYYTSVSVVDLGLAVGLGRSRWSPRPCVRRGLRQGARQVPGASRKAAARGSRWRVGVGACGGCESLPAVLRTIAGSGRPREGGDPRCSRCFCLESGRSRSASGVFRRHTSAVRSSP